MIAARFELWKESQIPAVAARIEFPSYCVYSYILSSFLLPHHRNPTPQTRGKQATYVD